MIQLITVYETFPLRPGEILRVGLPQSKAVEVIRVIRLSEKVGKDYLLFPATSKVVKVGSNKPHITTRNMERIKRYAPIRNLHYKD
jgi:hypothetical protein